MADGVHRLLNDLELTRLNRLFVNSRYTVEGQLQGAHPSPLKGFSVEFSDYRQYVPGDDLRHLDWRVFGRSDRLYIRQYEEECNLRAYLLVDGSRSMAYAGKGVTKYLYAARLAASLAYVTIHQQDSIGLTVFNTEQQVNLNARSGPAHLRDLANRLADFEPHGRTDLLQSAHRLAQAVQRRALIVLFTDLFDDAVISEPAKLKTALAHLKRRRHDVILYHVLDRTELEFPFRDLGNFEDLEAGNRVITNPRDIRVSYLEAIGEFKTRVQAVCTSLDVDYNLVPTDTPIPNFVRRHLNRRMGKR